MLNWAIVGIGDIARKRVLATSEKRRFRVRMVAAGVGASIHSIWGG